MASCKFSKDKLAQIKKFFTLLFILLFTAVITISFHFEANAGKPGGAHYSTKNGSIFWFLLITDTHIGENGATDSENLGWAVNEAIDIIKPKSVFNLGDLTDQYPFGLPGRDPDIEQWNEYRGIVDNAGMGDINNGVPIYSDIPGNHDQYHEDPPLANYLTNSIQGRATNSTQQSWLYKPSFGKYHFITVASPDPDMTSPAWDFLNGCPGELSDDENTFIRNALNSSENVDANLTFVFGHHGLGVAWGSIETGLNDFVSALGEFGVSMYAYGHTHADNYEPPYFENDSASLVYNVNSLFADHRYAIVAVDNDGVSVTGVHDAQVDAWPVVLITAPIDKDLGGENPYSYPVPKRKSNPIRALVFDANSATGVHYRIDGTGDWHPMTAVPSNQHLWEASWDASSLLEGEHSIEVQATSASGLNTDLITVNVTNTGAMPWVPLLLLDEDACNPGLIIELKNDDGIADRSESWGGACPYGGNLSDGLIGFRNFLTSPSYPIQVLKVKINFAAKNDYNIGFYLHVKDENGNDLLPSPFLITANEVNPLVA